eukprot:6962752-Prymnesium_polylepis.1
MSGGFDFDEVLQISLYLALLYLAGLLAKAFHISPIIGEMAIGVILGPEATNMVPYEDFFRLAGTFGVTLMIFESGLHVDFDMIKLVGLKACGVAVLGTFLPLLSGMYLMLSFDTTRYQLWPVGLAAGVTLAPTSVGMALKMLGEAKQLDQIYGQLIVTAAFIDDIFSLVLLTVLLEIGYAQQSGGGLALWSLFQPFVLSIAACGIGAALAYPLDPKEREKLTPVKQILAKPVGFFPWFVPLLIKFFDHSATTAVEISNQLAE